MAALYVTTGMIATVVRKGWNDVFEGQGPFAPLNGCRFSAVAWVCEVLWYVTVPLTP